MGYPIVLSLNGAEFARTNHDGSWSVRWNIALQARFEHINGFNNPLIAFATVLLAAKDNFHETSWEQSNAWVHRWEELLRSGNFKGRPLLVDVLKETPPVKPHFQLTYKNEIYAKINYDGSWSVKWTDIDIISRVQKTAANVGVIAFCNLLMSARDNFAVVPWKDVSPEKEEYQDE